MKWMYLNVEINSQEDSTETINEKGMEDWELVSVAPKYNGGGYLEKYIFFFKKPYVKPRATAGRRTAAGSGITPTNSRKRKPVAASVRIKKKE